MIYAYIRKSTSTQEFEHMEYEIKQYALANKIKINKWVEESISSRKPLSKRALGSLLETLQANDILIFAKYFLTNILHLRCKNNVFTMRYKPNKHCVQGRSLQ